LIAADEPTSSSSSSPTTTTTTKPQSLKSSNVIIAQQHHLSYLGGVRTNLPLPAVTSIGLGGGSIVKQGIGIGGGGGGVMTTVGPESVGSELMQKCLAVGGSTTTATAVALAMGSITIAELGVPGGGIKEAVSDE